MKKITVECVYILEEGVYLATMKGTDSFQKVLKNKKAHGAQEAVGSLFVDSFGNLKISSFYTGSVWTDRYISVDLDGENDPLDEMFFVGCADRGSELWRKRTYENEEMWLKAMRFLVRSKYSTEGIRNSARQAIDAYECESAESTIAVQGEQEHYEYQYDRKGKNGYVYILGGAGYYKIGLSKDPKQRISSFAPKLPFDTEIVHIIKTNDMYRLESELHAKFSGKRSNGEWFELDESELEQIRQTKTVGV